MELESQPLTISD